MKKNAQTPSPQKPFKAPVLIAKEVRTAASGSCGLYACGELVKCYAS